MGVRRRRRRSGAASEARRPHVLSSCVTMSQGTTQMIINAAARGCIAVGDLHPTLAVSFFFSFFFFGYHNTIAGLPPRTQIFLFLKKIISSRKLSFVVYDLL
ncbi:hypothetical protein M758_11G047600 [Ceratodon purpureus]|nr:hypothetical protein M758_11G047600 [Ceratodon purpureus]